MSHDYKMLHLGSVSNIGTSLPLPGWVKSFSWLVGTTASDLRHETSSWACGVHDTLWKFKWGDLWESPSRLGWVPLSIPLLNSVVLQRRLANRIVILCFGLRDARSIDYPHSRRYQASNFFQAMPQSLLHMPSRPIGAGPWEPFPNNTVGDKPHSPAQ